MAKKPIDLSCPACRSNRLSFPSSDDDPVTCDDCGAAVQTLRDVKLFIAGGGKTSADRAASRRERHVKEIEASQAALRRSIKETDRLAVQSEKMLRRHHKECDDDVA
jgi:iron-sulfur cluster repair protein YtfE (RIC family)